MTNIPDALRMVPGITVARIDSNKWAVSARGFAGRFANAWSAGWIEERNPTKTECWVSLRSTQPTRWIK
nr:hypothetical protein [uncultured Desulfobacter sp.]